MREKRAGRELAKWVAVTLTVLLGVYAAAYYTTVEQDYTVLDYVENDATWWPPFPPFYRVAGVDRTPSVRTFFAPMHRFDRRIRPHFWEPKP